MEMFKMWCLHKWLFCILFIMKGSVSLKNVTISVPKGVLSNHSAELSCTYDLEDAALYSIRWYRYQEEFYRYVPRELPPTKVFQHVLPNVLIDLDKSDEHRVTLSGLYRELSGEYMCEVSADEPLFHTDIKTALMYVVDPPAVPPYVVPDTLSYSKGDRLRANCSTGRSFPAPNITWYINGKQIPNTNTYTIDTSYETSQFEKQVAFSSLQLYIKDPDSRSIFGDMTETRSIYKDNNKLNTFKRDYYEFPAPAKGVFTLECVETIFEVHVGRDLVYLREDSPRPASVTGENGAGIIRSSLVATFLLNLLFYFYYNL